MKIGLACSGCGPGAQYAYILAEELTYLSLGPEMISCNSLPAAPMLLWSRGLPTDEIKKRTDRLFQEKESNQALSCFCTGLPCIQRCALALNSVDLQTGTVVTWADGLHSKAGNLKVKPLRGAEKKALSAAMKPWYGKGTEKLGKFQLCDFSARYGCPLFPLKMAGMERILSVVFTGQKDPAGAACESLSALTGKHADLQYVLSPSKAQEPEKIKKFFLDHQDELYEKLLF
ncbi:MAG: hypothetical protein HFG18_03340 [Oscillospiraceae bacterium]|nr:hypothetical protein [Oscillospiraceae bacterium]MCI9363106.1 hypothetical protein [Oscillospiraceae bacterium]RKJ58262.1 hypothetical protein D7X25_02580 [bacterium 1XD42-8]RKJ66905.1 hypothetical protein D7Y09_02130 [bacterium 1XD42-1]